MDSEGRSRQGLVYFSRILATGIGRDLERNKPSLGANLIQDVIEGARDRDVGKVVRRGGVQQW